MIKFIAGVIVGIVLATAGAGGIAHMIDRGVDTVKDAAR